MRRAILLMLTAAVSGGAAAAWVKVGDNDAKNAVVYIDTATITKHDGKAKIWRLFDLKSPDAASGEPYSSIMSQAEYDCELKQKRTLSAYYHSERMGHGAVVFSSAEPDMWEPSLPETLNDVLSQIACGKR